MMVGTAEQSRGGITTVIRILKGLPLWGRFVFNWLGVQMQGCKWQKICFALKSYIYALFEIWKYDIIHFHAVPVFACLIIQLPVYLLALVGHKKIIIHLHMGNQIGEYKDKRLFNWYIKRACLIVVLANLWKEKFKKEWFPHQKTPVEVLYNPYFPVESIDYEKREHTILMAAYLNENKGYDVLFRACQRILPKFPDWKLVIMGDGDVNGAKQLAKELGIDKQTIFAGYVVGDEKHRIFQEGSIYCMCSYQEGFPMVVLEAWGYGIPLITTPVGGLPDVIEEGKNAIVFPFGDVDCLANSLQLLIEDEKKRKLMSSFSKEFVEHKFSIDIVNHQLEDIYIRLLS